MQSPHKLMNLFPNRSLYLFLVSLFLLSSCKKDNPDEGFPRPLSERTILIYMAADNSLSQEVDAELKAIKAGWGSYNGRVLVYGDPADKAPALVEVRRKGKLVIADTVKRYPEHNSASSAVFKTVMEDAMHLFPSRSHGLIMFSHGSGWLPEGTLVQPRSKQQSLSKHLPPVVTYSAAMDGRNELELADMAKAIPDNHFDFIVFEQCFMAGVEVAYELRDKTRWIVASSAETLAPGFTPIYPQLLSCLFKQDPDLKGFAKLYYDHFNAQQGVYRSATISVINTSKLGALAAWVKTNAPYAEVQDAGKYQHFDRYSYHLFFDLEDYLKDQAPFESHAQLDALLQQAVPYCASTPQFMAGYPGAFDIRKHSGLTTYIPQSGFPFLNQKYTGLQWYKAIR